MTFRNAEDCSTRDLIRCRLKKLNVAASRRGLLLSLSVALGSKIALADNFSQVLYDARDDQLIVTMRYRGTTPDHTFSITWGACREGKDGREIEATVLDSQWRDAAQRNFSKTTHFSLADLNCRPSKLTLRTAPRFYYTVQIPARNIRAP